MQQQTDDTVSASLEIRPALTKSKQHTGGDSTSVFQLKRKSVVEQARAYSSTLPYSVLYVQSCGVT